MGNRIKQSGRAFFGVATKSGKVVLGDVLEKYALKSDSKQLSSAEQQSDILAAGLVQPPYDPVALVQLLAQNTWHSRCTYLKANDAAGLGWHLAPTIKKDEDREPSEEQKAELRQFFTANIKKHNNLTELLVSMAVDFEALSYAYFEIIRENFDPNVKPDEIRHAPAQTMFVHKEKNKYAQIRGAKKRWFKNFNYDRDVDYMTGKEYPLGSLPPERRATEIIMIKLYSPMTEYYGISQIVTALSSITGLYFLANYNLSFFSSYGIPSYAIYITGDYDLGLLVDSQGRDENDPEFDVSTAQYPIITEIETHLQTISENPSAPLIMAIPTVQGEGGKVNVEFKPLGLEVKESSFRLYRKDARDEILAAHGVPAYRLGITETGSLGGSTAEESTEIYKTSVINPKKNIYESAINKLIQVGFEIEDWVFVLNELDTSDEEHDKDIAEFLFNSGAMTPNQLIRYFGDRFGIQPDDDEPLLNAHYIGGKPVEGTTADELIQSVKQLHGRLVNIAIKDKVSDTDG